PAAELIARVFVIPSPDAEAARAAARRLVAAYLTVPAYAAFHDWLGRGGELRPMQAAWAAGDRRAALTLIPDKIVDELVVHGEPARCRERLAAYQAGGLDTPVIAVLPVPGMDEAEAVRQLAPA
ncbi:MAG: LLM class flavin-dependent oxidoreductase, partial [Actinobacteria bacterium]|nr:LLM class flavin-dependent oxidoreductase [Actinomycetota bacterium]